MDYLDPAVPPGGAAGGEGEDEEGEGGGGGRGGAGGRDWAAAGAGGGGPGPLRGRLPEVHGPPVRGPRGGRQEEAALVCLRLHGRSAHPDTGLHHLHLPRHLET